MKIVRRGLALLLLACSAQPCSPPPPPLRRLWAKPPGSTSKLFAFEKDGKVGFIDPAGNVVIPPTLASLIGGVGDFSSGLVSVGNIGYFDERGSHIIMGPFRWLGDFSDGLAQVGFDDSGGIARSQYIDSTGKIVMPSRTTSGAAFSEGFAVYPAPEPNKPRSDRRFQPSFMGFIDRTGKIAIQPVFADVGPFSGGLAKAAVDGYCHVADPDRGKLGTPTSGATMCGVAPEGVNTPCGVGFINSFGTFAIQPVYESARDFREGLAAVRIDDRWGYVGTDGVLVIKPRFARANSFREGLAAVWVDGKWGFIDKTGAIVIAPQFDEVEAFSDSLALARRNREPFFIDSQGKTVITGKFLEATSFTDSPRSDSPSTTSLTSTNREQPCSGTFKNETSRGHARARRRRPHRSYRHQGRAAQLVGPPDAESDPASADRRRS